MADLISQIYITDSDSAPLPPYFQYCVEQVKQGFTNCRHSLYNGGMLRQFIAENFGAEVLKSYDILKPYAYKADLGRYCLLYQYGGWYLDIATRVLNPINIGPEIQSLAFRDMQYASATSYACSNTVLYAKQNDPVFERAISLIVENCNNKYYGVSTLCPTGPNVLGRAFASQGGSQSRIFGEHLLLTPYHKLKNGAFVMPDGLIFALKKPALSGGLDMFGAIGTNNYEEIYKAGNAYSETS